ncbi:hypothetical protein [Ferrimonas balearica]|uniref:hypothetical protein n=1 Tax=Ferrimonas balearica TaxID=44012 RepID=UPI00059D5E01|nr:hypothetical protein [Ferrimonas balearica]
MDRFKLMKELGASPESFGFKEDVPKEDIDRFCLIKELWSSIVSKDDTSWIDIYIKGSQVSGAANYIKRFGRHLSHMRSVGMSDSDIAEVINISQYMALSEVIGVIDMGVASKAKSKVGKSNEISDFGLFFCDEKGNPSCWVGYLHEFMEESAPDGQKEGYVDQLT